MYKQTIFLFNRSILRSSSFGFNLATMMTSGKRCLTIKSLDHLVLTCNDLKKTITFYEKLGMKTVEFGQGRKALSFGNQKMNLHQKGKEFEPKAKVPQPGSADLCFIIEENSLDSAMKRLKEEGIEIVEGPVNRTGAIGKILSIYVRDPDENLIEVS